MSHSYRRRKKHGNHRYRKTYRRSDRHHIFPKGSGGPDTKENIIVLDRRLHELIHAVFSDMPPTQYLPYVKRNPDVAVFRLVRGAVRCFGPGVVEAALKEAVA